MHLDHISTVFKDCVQKVKSPDMIVQSLAREKL